MVRGISTATTLRRAAAIAIAGAATAALSACGAGLETQTDSKATAVAGINVDEGDLAFRDLQIEFDAVGGYLAGEDAALRVWIGNEGQQAVSLVGVEVESGIGTVTFVSPAAQAEAEASASEAATEEATTEDETGDEASTETPTAEETTPEEPLFDGAEVFDIPIAPADYVRLDQSVEGGDYLLLENLNGDLALGDVITVVFHFSNNEQVKVDLPFGQSLDADDREYYEPKDEGGH